MHHGDVSSFEGRLTASRNYVTLEDLRHFLPAVKAEAALKVMDANADGRISLQDMRDAVTLIYKERKNLAFTLKVASATLVLQTICND